MQYFVRDPERDDDKVTSKHYTGPFDSIEDAVDTMLHIADEWINEWGLLTSFILNVCDQDGNICRTFAANEDPPETTEEVSHYCVHWHQPETIYRRRPHYRNKTFSTIAEAVEHAESVGPDEVGYNPSFEILEVVDRVVAYYERRGESQSAPEYDESGVLKGVKE